jgi:hypothetical protein
MKIIKQIILEKKILGINYFIPYFVLIVVFVLSYILSNHISGLSVLINIFQIIIPFFCTWWIIFLFHETLEHEGAELVFTFKSNKISLGFLMTIKFYLIYLIPSILTVALGFKLFFNIFNLSFLIQIIVQCLFFSSFSFLIMSIFKNVSLTIFILVSYIIFSYYTTFRILIIPKVLIVGTNFSGILNTNSIILECLVYSLVYCIIGQIIFNENSVKTSNDKFE